MQFSYTTAVILSLSILVAGIIGIVRFAKIDNKHKPFIYLIWIGCINEGLSIYLAFNGHHTIVNGVIYDLCESLFLLWFFKNLGVFKSRRYLFYFLGSLFVVIWIVETFLKNRFGTSFTYYFNVAYYFVVVLLSIRVINNLLFTEKELLKNSTFLICVGLIIFFTYGIISRMFWLYGLKNSTAFVMNVQSIYMLINVLSNLIYALAVMYMRKRQAFTFQF